MILKYLEAKTVVVIGILCGRQREYDVINCENSWDQLTRLE